MKYLDLTVGSLLTYFSDRMSVGAITGETKIQMYSDPEGNAIRPLFVVTVENGMITLIPR